MQTAHVATIKAYQNQFGSWTGVIHDKDTKEIVLERFHTMNEARNWVRIKAREMFGAISFAAIRRKNEYYAKCWKQV